MSALDELREGLREAARRDVEAGRFRNRRRRRRATGFVILALLGGGAAAGAADLISVGEPLRDPAEQTPAYRPAGARDLQIALTTPSGGKLPYGVVIYTARNGQRCALAGVIRGASLGLVDNGKFRPYGSGRTGSCMVGTRPFQDQIALGDRTLIYGRAAPRTRTVRLKGIPGEAPVGKGGAFLFVLGKVAPNEAFELEQE
jgi:hypothetical protein